MASIEGVMECRVVNRRQQAKTNYSHFLWAIAQTAALILCLPRL